MVTQEVPAHGADHGGHTEAHAHPGPKTYIQIAVILAIITAIEVFILYLPEMGFGAARPFLVPAFIILSVLKFVLVVGWYMHLKFDDSFYLRMFAFSLIIALTLATGFIALFHGIHLGL